MSDDTDDKDTPSLPNARDVLAGVSVSSQPSEVSREEQNYIKRFARNSAEQQLRYIHLVGIRDHYRHKGYWSSFLMFAIASMIAFQSILLALVGWGFWDFSLYKWLLPALLVQNLTQVVGLSVWAVRYLFSDISRQKPE